MTEVEWKPQKVLAIPLHQQISDYIKSKIINGEWTIGTKIPPQRQLAELFNVNRSTIVSALDELVADGLIESKVGSGTMVINNTWNLLASTPSLDWINYVKSGSHHPNMEIIQKINQAETDSTIIRLGTGELSPDLLPKKYMKQILNLVNEKSISLGYMPPKGSLSLRKTLSKHLKSKGIETSPESILIVSGGIQALQLISIGLLRKGSTILHETPSYLNSIHVFQSAGMNLLGVPLDHEGIVVDSIEQISRQHHASLLYTIPSFHNPTGILMSEERRKQLLYACQKVSLPIIEDDVYGDLWFDNFPSKPLKSYDSQGNVIYLGSVSKALSPGLRIGWIVGPQPVIERLADIKMQTDYGSSSLSQDVIDKWISSGLYEEFLKEIREDLRLRRDFMLQILKKYFSDIATWNVPNGGFYIWLTLKVSVSSQKLFHIALREGILLNPGIVYDKRDDQHLRMSYSYASLEQLETGLILLAQFIRNASRH